MNNGNNIRNASVDHAKAIGIFLIGIGHFLTVGSNLRIVLYSFHVPLFFVLAGIAASVRSPSNQSIARRILKLGKRVLLPYMVWFWISAILPYFLWGTSLRELLMDFLFLRGKMIWNTALWFCPCYFITMCVFEIMCCITQRKAKGLLVSAILAFCLAVMFDCLQVENCLLGIDKCCLMYVFVILGYLTRRVAEKHQSWMFGIVCMTVFAVSGVVSSIYHAGNNISVLNVDYNNIVVFAILAAVMSLSFVGFCTVLPPSKFVSIIAKNTLFIMSTHLVFRQICDLYIDVPDSYFFMCLVLIPGYMIVIAAYNKLAIKNDGWQKVGSWLGLGCSGE